MSEERSSQRLIEPAASRPYMPGYGIADAEGGKGLLAWSWATERLSNARNYWLATTRPDGRPHVMPVWGIWLDDVFYFSTGEQSRKARNLAANPQCVVSVEQGNEAVIIEGVAEVTADPTVIKPFAEAYAHKYEWDMEGFAEPIYAVHPAAVFGLSSNTGEFTQTATRWVFKSAREVTKP